MIAKPNRFAVFSTRDGSRGENSRRLVVQLVMITPDWSPPSGTPVLQDVHVPVKRRGRPSNELIKYERPNRGSTNLLTFDVFVLALRLESS